MQWLMIGNLTLNCGTSAVQARVYSLVEHGHTERLWRHTRQLWAETRPGAGAERQESSGDPDGEDWSGCGVTADYRSQAEVTEQQSRLGVDAQVWVC